MDDDDGDDVDAGAVFHFSTSFVIRKYLFPHLFLSFCVFFCQVIKSYLKQFLLLWGEAASMSSSSGAGSDDDESSDDDEEDGGGGKKSSKKGASNSKQMSCQIAAFFRVRQVRRTQESLALLVQQQQE